MVKGWVRIAVVGQQEERKKEKEHKERKITCTLKTKGVATRKRKGVKVHDFISYCSLCLENSDSVKSM